MSEEPPQIDLPPTMDDDMPPSDDEAEEPTVDIEEEDLQNFWSAQSAPEYNPEYNLIEEGPVKIQRIEDVSKEPVQLPEGIEWCTVDPLKGDELDELWELLNRQYVEDEDSMFRFDYSKTMLKWALMPPGWKKSWHLGLRDTSSHQLIAFISAIPMTILLRQAPLSVFSFNFLCISRAFRSKRLTPVLITEVTRRCNLEGLWQAFHTSGTVLPRSVSAPRYFHRLLNWKKLWEVGFCPLPRGSTVEEQVMRYALVGEMAIKGLREMEVRDVDAVKELFDNYSARWDLAPQFSRDEVEHWLVHKKDGEEVEQILWSYVVENEERKITDFFSFYCVESTVLDPTISAKHPKIRVAYLFYYASDVGLKEPFNKEALKTRLNALIAEALLIADQFKFDVFNTLSMMDNALFLSDQKFGTGDGILYYYLSNYKVNPISSGMKVDNKSDIEGLSGVGIVNL